eukprot:6485909-Amphidinium_carterae.1
MTHHLPERTIRLDGERSGVRFGEPQSSSSSLRKSLRGEHTTSRSRPNPHWAELTNVRDCGRDA